MCLCDGNQAESEWLDCSQRTSRNFYFGVTTYFQTTPSITHVCINAKNTNFFAYPPGDRTTAKTFLEIPDNRITHVIESVAWKYVVTAK